MNNSRLRWRCFGLGALAVLAFGFFCCGEVHAVDESTMKSIKSKAAFEGVYQCVGNYKADWKTTDGGLGFINNFKPGNSDAVKLPYGWTAAGNNKANCNEIMKGFSGERRDDDKLDQGLIPNKIRNGSAMEIVEFFAGPEDQNGDHNGEGGFGYKAEGVGNVEANQPTQQLSYSVAKDSNCFTSNGLSDDPGKIVITSSDGTSIGTFDKIIFPTITTNNNGNWFFGDTSSNSDGTNVPPLTNGSQVIYQYTVCGATFNIAQEGDADQVYYVIQGPTQIGWQQIATITASKDSYGNVQTFKVTGQYDLKNGEMPTSYDISFVASIAEGTVSESEKGKYDEYKLIWAAGNDKFRFVKGINNKNNVSGYKLYAINSYKDLALKQQEVYDLYKYYLRDVYKVPVICANEENYSLYNNANNPVITWNKNNTCRAYVDYPGKEEPTNVYGVDIDKKSSTYLHFVKEIYLNDVIDTLKAEVLTDFAKLTGTDEGGTIDEIIDQGNQQQGTGTASDDTNVCYKGAGPLGWIVCPVTAGLTSVGSALYGWIEENFLQVRASIFTDAQNGVWDVWNTVRNIANIGFIIVFLIVIISQVTGFGIDNYGIKRILPKIVIGAIVMNLSYIICELMIDVSNIAGSGLRDLLTNMAPPLVAPDVASDPGFMDYVVAGGGILAAGAIMLLTQGGLGVILMLLMALLAIVIAIAVLFVTLIVRQAGIVVCVVISPIVVLCYLLPNMEKYSKKWLGLMKGLLVVYPVCGLLIGAGTLVGHIFGNLAHNSTDGLQTGFALSAMVVTAVPYLFIPTLLKSSLSAMGNLGAKISGFGSKLRGRTSKGIKGSSAMERAKERATRNRAGVDKYGNVKELGRFRRAIRGGNRGMARARAQYLKNQDVRNRETSLMGTRFKADIVAQEKKVAAEAVDSELVLLKSQTNDGADEQAVQEAFDEAMINGDWAKARAAVRLAGRRKDTATNFAANTLLSKNYSSEALSKIAKEISEGETAKNYRAASPLAFEYASQLNKGSAKGAKGGAAANYADWMSNKENIHDAIDHHIENGRDLLGVQGKNLRQLVELANNGGMNDDDADYLRTVARDAIRANQKNGTPFSYPKAEPIYQLAYGSEYLDKMREDGISNLKTNVRGAAPNQGNEVNIDLRALGDDTLLDIATNPNTEMGDATRTAAEREYNRRTGAAGQNEPPKE